MAKARRDKMVEALSRSGSVRDFLSTVFSPTGPIRMTYSQVARNAGFASRAFPREIALGRRGLTLATIPKFKKALGLSHHASTYFELLCALDYPKTNLQGLTSGQIRERLSALRSVLRQSPNRHVEKTQTSIYRLKNWPHVFAILPPEGMTLEEISRYLGISEKACSMVLKSMEDSGIVILNENRYVPIQNHFHHVEKHHPGAFREFYLDSLRILQRRAREKFIDGEHLFLNSVFSVPRSEMSRLKAELRDLLLRFIVQSEATDQENLCLLSCGLVPQVNPSAVG